MDETTLEAYFGRLAVPRPHTADAVNLHVLHRAHQMRVPSENLSIHLSEPALARSPARALWSARAPASQGSQTAWSCAKQTRAGSNCSSRSIQAGAGGTGPSFPMCRSRRVRQQRASAE